MAHTDALPGLAECRSDESDTPAQKVSVAVRSLRLGVTACWSVGWPARDPGHIRVCRSCEVVHTDHPQCVRGAIGTEAPQRMLAAYGCSVTLEELAGRLREFAAAREWEQFHTPKNLVMALAGEVGELVAGLQWLTPGEAARVMGDAGAAARMRSELADVTIYLVRLADVLGVDLIEAAGAKLAEGERRYDVENYRGSARKAPPMS